MKTLIIFTISTLLFFAPRLEAAPSPASYAMAHKKKASTGKCWRYVKLALYKTGKVSSYPQTRYAKQAAQELTKVYGFRKLPIRDPYKAPVNAIIVYGGKGAGHVEIRTPNGFVSDYFSERALKSRPVIAILVRT